MSDLDTKINDLESQLRELYSLENPTPETEVSSESADNNVVENSEVADQKSQEVSEQEKVQYPEKVKIDDQEVNFDDLLTAYKNWREAEGYIQSRLQLLRTIEQRSQDQQWAEALRTLLSDNWKDALVVEEESAEEEEQEFSPFGGFFEEEEGEEEKESNRSESERVRATKATSQDIAAHPEFQSLLQMVWDLQYQQGQRDFEMYRSEFESKYGPLSQDEWKRIFDISEQYDILTDKGWWTPKHGNPIELIARLDPELSKKLNTSVPSEEIKKRQAMDAVSGQAAPPVTKQKQRSKVEELEDLIRETYGI